MSQSKLKLYRRAVKRSSQKNYNKYIYDYIEGLCREPLKVRLHYLWLIICKKNPHTGKKVV